MNWYTEMKEAGRVGDLARGLGLGVGVGLSSSFTAMPPAPAPAPAPIEQPAPTQSPSMPLPPLDPPSQPKVEKFDLAATVAPIIARHEGKRPTVYLDSLGIPTIGIGFNLQRPDARRSIEALGLDYDAVVKGQQSLTEQQIQHLFMQDVRRAAADAKRIVPDLETHPKSVQLTLTDMTFNLGATGLSKFRNMLEAVKQRDYQKMAQEMKSSRWFNQTGNRSKYLVSLIENVR